MLRIDAVYVVLLASLILSGCGMTSGPAQDKVSAKPKYVPTPRPKPDTDLIGRWLKENGLDNSPYIKPPSTLLDTLYQHYASWQGVRYQPGGMSKDGVDCSGFATLTFAELFNIHIPRNTTDQSQIGVDVDKSDLRGGDLVFFRIDKRTQHVGIYLENDNFLHASTSRGVAIDNINDNYWRGRYWKSIRLPDL